MASSLPPPGASRPPPPLAPPSVDEPPPSDEPEAVAFRPATAAPLYDHHDDADDVRARRPWGAERWILLVGFGLVAVALGVIANQAWLMGIEGSWVWWSSIIVVPSGLAALAALFGWRHTRGLAIVASVCTTAVALVGLVRQPPLGLPQAVCAIAAIAITVAASSVAHRSGGDAAPVHLAESAT